MGGLLLSGRATNLARCVSGELRDFFRVLLGGLPEDHSAVRGLGEVMGQRPSADLAAVGVASVS